MSDAVVFINEYQCRICYEQEVESCGSLECPCACSGTLKFAHRDCIQRWCDEKGNTTCEICLQKFKPGYSAQVKKPHLVPTTATISLDVARNEAEGILETDVGVACCRSLAFVFTILLLIRNLFYQGEKVCPFSRLTVFLVKATGIIVPVYALIRITVLIHNSLNNQRYRLSPDSNEASSTNEDTNDNYA